VGFELTTLVVIGTDCTGSCKYVRNEVGVMINEIFKDSQTKNH